MSLKKISRTKLNQEVQIQNSINNLLNKYENFIFNAGAGAGKTYSLIEALKYVIKNNGDRLKYHNQKIVCITYTNVAVDEIKERLGNSSVVMISTIHETFWSLIKKYQKELILIHKEKVEETLNEEKNQLFTDEDVKVVKVFKSFRELEQKEKEEFRDLVSANKDSFYTYYDCKSKEFKEAMSTVFDSYSSMLKNVASFKKIVTTIYKIENLEKCLERMDSQDENFQTVRYDSKFNNDVLHRMIISHDTLLEYSLKLFEQYPLLRKIVIDAHPYFFVDEYQDTNPKVINTLNYLSEYSEGIRQDFCVGYFGDKIQNIYDDGVGSQVDSIHKGLQSINKCLNRRSCEEVIDVINKIRGDDIVQSTIYENNRGGDVNFYYSNNSEKIPLILSFLERCSSEWQVRPGEKIHCLVLTNRLVALLSGFGGLYECISKTPFYKKNYDSLNTELLSQNRSKLGIIPNVLFKLLKLKFLSGRSSTPISELLPDCLLSKMSLKELRGLVQFLSSSEGGSLYEFCEYIYDNHQNDSYITAVLSEVVELDSYSFVSFKRFIVEHLYPNLSDADRAAAVNTVSNLLKVNIDEFKEWYDFITESQVSRYVYHTYHGTKGREFDNVVIVMENDFGVRNKQMFSTFFKNFPI